MARKKKRSQDSKRRTKKNSSVLEYEIMKMMESCLKTAINKALDDVFRN